MGGCLPCWREFDNGVFNEGGGLGFRLHFYPSKQYKQSDQHKVQCTSTWSIVYDDVHGTDVLSIPFKCCICNRILQIQTPHMIYNLTMLHMTLFDQVISFLNVYDMPLKFKYNVVCFYGSNCKSIWNEFNLIQIKPNSKS